MTEHLTDRIADALKWTPSDVRRFSLPTLREMVRTVDPKLSREITQVMRGPGYYAARKNQKRRNKMRIKVRHRSRNRRVTKRRKSMRNRRVMKRNLPLKKKYGGKYFTVKAFARKYAKKFGGKAKARKQWSKLREAKHGSIKLKTQRNKRRRKARKSRRNFRGRSRR